MGGERGVLSSNSCDSRDCLGTQSEVAVIAHLISLKFRKPFDLPQIQSHLHIHLSSVVVTLSVV